MVRPLDLKISKNNQNKVTKKKKYNEITDNCIAKFNITNLRTIGLEIGRRGTIGFIQVFGRIIILINHHYMKFQL